MKYTRGVCVWHNKSHTVAYKFRKGKVYKIKYKWREYDYAPQLTEIKNDFSEIKYQLARLVWKDKNIRIMSLTDTVNEVINNNLSVARFGDGEINLMLSGYGPGFQKYNVKLAERLKEVFTQKETKLQVCLTGDYGRRNFSNNYWKGHIYKVLFPLVNCIEAGKVFGDTNITRVADNVPRMKEIWKDKDIVIVEGEKSRLGVGNDLFDNVKSISRILCPAKNAFDKYDKILAECVKIPQDKLLLLALGPTATVLAYDLCKRGYRAVDVGHIDICYEWKLRNNDGNPWKKQLIPGKYVNEVAGGGENIPDCTDPDYLKSIISRIL